MLAWAVAQLIGLLLGGWALLGFQQGQPGTGVLGVLLLLGPPAIAFAAWRLAGQTADPTTANMILGGGALLLLVSTGALVALVAGNGGPP